MGYILITAVSWFFDVIIYLLLGRAILSWFIQGPYGTLYKIYVIISKLTEPIVAPCRNFTMRFNTGMLDLSVLLAFFLVSLARRVIVSILWFALF